LLECGLDAAAAETAVEESTYLLSGQEAIGGRVDGFEDTVGGVVAGGFAEKEGGACGAIVLQHRRTLSFLGCHFLVAVNHLNSRVYGGDDGARTRDLCRDRAAL
jgi:hypothetical protein